MSKISKFKKPILVSTAGRTGNEINESLEILSKNQNKITLMHGFQGFPTKIDDLNLKRIKTLNEKFGYDVGLMDHVSGDSTLSLIIPLLGMSFGAKIIEKHITLDRSAKELDYFSALNPNEFKNLISLIRKTEKTFGDSTLKLSKNEISYRYEHIKNSIIKNSLPKNTILTDKLIEFKRTNRNVDTLPFFDYRGLKLKIKISQDIALTKKFVEKEKVAAVIACRINSTRLMGKPLQNVGNYTILELLLKQLNKSKLIDDIVLAISEHSGNEIFVDFAKKNSLKYILGDDADVLSRLIEGAKYVGAKHIFRITPENPFMYWEKIDHVISNHIKNKYDFSTVADVPLGSNFEVIRLTALEKSHNSGKKKHRSEFCSLYINENKKKFKTYQHVSNPNVQRTELRLTVDTPEDLIVARTIYKKLAKKKFPIPLHEIIKFLDQNPYLIELNSGIDVKYRVWSPKK